MYRVPNSAGYHWRSVAKKGKLTEAQLAARKVFVDAHLDKSAAWWRQHFGLALDGVALTKAPRPLNSREKHAAQAIKHMWVKSGEAQDNSLHTYNRYGVQLGDKVPFWGGFTGDGKLAFKLWAERPQLDRLWGCQRGWRRAKQTATGNVASDHVAAWR